MTIDRRVDTPFLTKFNRDSPYLKSEDDLFASIMEEIGNILSTKLKTFEISYNSPYSYGVRDLQSLENSKESLDTFEENCRRAILRFEPRVSDVTVIKSHINNNLQTLELELSCYVPLANRAFSTKITLHS